MKRHEVTANNEQTMQSRLAHIGSWVAPTALAYTLFATGLPAMEAHQDNVSYCEELQSQPWGVRWFESPVRAVVPCDTVEFPGKPADTNHEYYNGKDLTPEELAELAKLYRQAQAPKPGEVNPGDVGPDPQDNPFYFPDDESHHL
jgi:hypothetical protein